MKKIVLCAVVCLISRIDSMYAMQNQKDMEIVQEKKEVLVYGRISLSEIFVSPNSHGGDYHKVDLLINERGVELEDEKKSCQYALPYKDMCKLMDAPTNVPLRLSLNWSFNHDGSVKNNFVIASTMITAEQKQELSERIACIEQSKSEQDRIYQEAMIRDFGSSDGTVHYRSFSVAPVENRGRGRAITRFALTANKNCLRK